MTRKKLYILFLSLSLAGYGWLACNVITASGEGGPPAFCLFKEVTGLPCPSCGATRSVLLLGRGDFEAALLLNPLGFLLVAGLLVIPFWLGYDIVRRRESFYRRYNAIEEFLRQKKWVVFAAGIFLLINWAWNITKGL